MDGILEASFRRPLDTYAFLRKKKDLDLCFTCSKKSRPGKSDDKMG